MKSVTEVLERARQSGVTITVDDTNLCLEADQPPPPDLLHDLRRYKPAILQELSGEPRASDWDVDAWRTYSDERAGIGEFDGELSRVDAEAQAFEDCVAQWLAMHRPEPTAPERCAECGEALGDDGLPLRTHGGHVWLHDVWHSAWMARRRDDAERALRGI